GADGAREQQMPPACVATARLEVLFQRLWKRQPSMPVSKRPLDQLLRDGRRFRLLDIGHDAGRLTSHRRSDHRPDWRSHDAVASDSYAETSQSYTALRRLHVASRRITGRVFVAGLASAMSCGREHGTVLVTSSAPCARLFDGQRTVIVVSRSCPMAL